MLWAALLLLTFFGGCAGLVIFISHSLEDAKKAHAQLGCQGVATATEAYTWSDKNTKHELPNTLGDIIRPPFGGPSFLLNGEADLRAPWGKPHQMERATKLNGDKYFIVKTIALNGTPISMFGIGKNSAPRASV